MQTPHHPHIAVCADPPDHPGLAKRAQALANALNLPQHTPTPATHTKEKTNTPHLRLAVTPSHLELRVTRGEADLIAGRGVFAKLEDLDTTSPAGRTLDMPLLKAVGIKKGKPHRPHVIDCTAGLGEDAWLLASHRCTVTAIERHPVIAALLDDAIQRAAATQPHTADRITRHQANAADWLLTNHPASSALGQPQPNPTPHAILLDPMFPLGRRAKERKPMRVLRLLAGNDDDAPALLDAALQTQAHRICVKRPRHAPSIQHPTHTKPDITYQGKALRFDVYINTTPK